MTRSNAKLGILNCLYYSRLGIVSASQICWEMGGYPAARCESHAEKSFFKSPVE